MFIFHWEKGFPVFLCSRASRGILSTLTYRLSVQRDDETESEKEREREANERKTGGGEREKETACGSILTQGRRETLRRR